MRKNLFLLLLLTTLSVSCNKDKEVLNTLNEYNVSREAEGYHFGDQLVFPPEVTEDAQRITISFGDKETTELIVSPEFYTLGDNAVTINIQKKNGEILTQDATINVFAKNPEAVISYEIVKEYPHAKDNFVQGIQLEGNIVYESDGQKGSSKLVKYTLGSTENIAETPQPQEVFSEGCTIVRDKIYQLTWQNKIGFVYDKASLKMIGQFNYPNILGEGWGLTYDGSYLIASDGSKNLYYLDAANPEKFIKYISVAGHTNVYDQLNELEYHNGFIYANVWQKPIILKINPKTGEVVGKMDLTAIAEKHTAGNDDVLNGITFKGQNMLVTGKLWDTIYELKLN